MDLNRHPASTSVTAYFTGGALAAIGSIALVSPPGFAQLTPDGTLGTTVNPGAAVEGLPAILIEGGTPANSNLFHSFQEFNVNAGQRVYFANPIEIQNILTRVTGGNPSSIDGLLGVDGAANLFLLNPNGVFFGPNAQLDINGSFLTSTANTLFFNDGSTFSTVPTDGELLSVSVPLGVQFNEQQIASPDPLQTITFFPENSNQIPEDTFQVIGETIAFADSLPENGTSDVSFAASESFAGSTNLTFRATDK